MPALVRRFVGGPGVPWTCQLVCADVRPGTVVLDFVALEPAPAYPDACRRCTPFTLHVDAGTRGRTFEQAVAQWVRDADIVSIMFGATDGTPWLSLSAGDRHLVLELSSPDALG